MHKLLTLHLSLIDGIGPSIIAHLQKHPAYQDLYACTAQEVADRYRVSFKKAELIAAGLKEIQTLEKEVVLIERHTVSFVTLGDACYPPLLKEIDYPPSVLYYWGAALHSFDKNIAVIGSRAAGAYGAQAIAACVPQLVHAGWCIISGGAVGADTMAHEQTLASAGRTVAILGSGLLHLYPKSNKKLFETVMQSGGAVVSPFPLQTIPQPTNFPARNRIIAGMSKACLVVQAAERSGASITAEFALNQGKLVCAIPGSIFDPLSAGCHALIKEGATPISSADDLLKELGEKTSMQTALTEKKNDDQNRMMPAVPTEKKNQPVAKSCGPEGTIPERILYYCAEPLSTDDLLVHIEIDMHELQNHLFDLQLAGRLEQNAVGLWQVARL